MASGFRNILIDQSGEASWSLKHVWLIFLTAIIGLYFAKHQGITNIKVRYGQSISK